MATTEATHLRFRCDAGAVSGSMSRVPGAGREERGAKSASADSPRTGGSALVRHVHRALHHLLRTQRIAPFRPGQRKRRRCREARQERGKLGADTAPRARRFGLLPTFRQSVVLLRAVERVPRLHSKGRRAAGQRLEDEIRIPRARGAAPWPRPRLRACTQGVRWMLPSPLTANAHGWWAPLSQ